MKIIAINGSPRKNGNTMAMIDKFLEGVRSADESIETKVINIYSLNYTGCRSCFACKRIGSTYGKSCAIKDDIHDVLEKISQSDGVVIGSPIYFGEIVGQLKSFLERMCFPFFTYEVGYRSIAPKHFPITMIYTMNVTKEAFDELGYSRTLSNMESFVGHTYSQPELLYAFNTYQFKDYSKYKIECFSESDKRKYRDEQLPKDLQSAFKAGKAMVEKIKK